MQEAEGNLYYLLPVSLPLFHNPLPPFAKGELSPQHLLSSSHIRSGLANLECYRLE